MYLKFHFIVISFFFNSEQFPNVRIYVMLMETVDTVNTGKVKVMTVIGVTTVVEVQCLVVVVVNGVMLKFQR